MDHFIVILDAISIYKLIDLHLETGETLNPRSLAAEQGYFMGRGGSNLFFEILHALWQPGIAPPVEEDPYECEIWDVQCIEE